jgi:hypothetical protein
LALRISMEAFMTRWIAAVIVVTTLLIAVTANDGVAAAPLPASVQQAAPYTSDLGASRRARHHPRYASRRHERIYRSYFYYDRPFYYAPAPFVPFNFGYTVPWW